MGTVIVLERRAGRGRQPAEVEVARDARDELTACRAETAERYARLLAGARRAQVSLAAGRSAAEVLDAMERDLVRGLNQLAAAAAADDAICLDGETRRHVGCGQAA